MALRPNSNSNHGLIEVSTSVTHKEPGDEYLVADTKRVVCDQFSSCKLIRSAMDRHRKRLFHSRRTFEHGALTALTESPQCCSLKFPTRVAPTRRAGPLRSCGL